MKQLVRGLVLAGAIALGGYVFGTPGDQLIAAFCCGALAMVYTLSEAA